MLSGVIERSAKEDIKLEGEAVTGVLAVKSQTGANKSMFETFKLPRDWGAHSKRKYLESSSDLTNKIPDKVTDINVTEVDKICL